MLKLAITPGEPAGIGPDLLLRIAAEDHGAVLVAVADPQLLEERAARLGLSLRLCEFNLQTIDRAPPETGCLYVLPVKLPNPAVPGQLDPRNAEYVLRTLREATTGCLRHTFDALVTGPVHKAVINDAGVAFTGHTEFLAELTGTARVVMLLASPRLRVALATTHLPLRAVADAIEPSGLEQTLRILLGDLQRRFAIAKPTVLVSGLNPHAGEGGHLGREEIEIISPTLEKLRAEGFSLIGPLPADTLFNPAQLERGDAVLAMYHDQGLPVIKASGFGETVNITLGLPIIRTSVDHGTALELAGTAKADPSSLRAAVKCAVELAQNARTPR